MSLSQEDLEWLNAGGMNLAAAIYNGGLLAMNMARNRLEEFESSKSRGEEVSARIHRGIEYMKDRPSVYSSEDFAYAKNRLRKSEEGQERDQEKILRVKRFMVALEPFVEGKEKGS